MKKISIILSAVALVLSSCSKSDDTPIVVDPVVDLTDNVLIKQIVESNGTSVTNTTTFTYNDKKIVKTEDTQGKKVVFTYVGDLITKKITTSNSTLIETEDYTYNTDNKLISYSSLEAGSVPKFEYYDNISQIATIGFNNYGTGNYIAGSSIDGNISFLGNQAEIFYYEISLITAPIGSQAKYTNTYASDSNKSFYKNITGFKNVAYAGFKNLYTGYDRNVRKVTKFKKNTATNVETTSTITWVYTYNSNGFPSSSVKTSINTSGVSTVTNISYVY